MTIKGRRELVLEKFARENNWEIGAELGVWKGRTFKHLLSKLPNLKLIGVDLYAPQPDNEGPEKWVEGENGHEWDHDRYYNDIVQFCESVNGRGIMYRMYTHEAALKVEDESLDFIFIDADHSYEGVKKDLTDWIPKVKKGGYICGHDIDWEGVNKALVEFFGEDFIEEADNVWYHIKK